VRRTLYFDPQGAAVGIDHRHDELQPISDALGRTGEAAALRARFALASKMPISFD
jgi:hypothetical protein